MTPNMHYQTFDDMAAGIASTARRRDAVIVTPLVQAPSDPSLANGHGPDATLKGGNP